MKKSLLCLASWLSAMSMYAAPRLQNAYTEDFGNGTYEITSFRWAGQVDFDIYFGATIPTTKTSPIRNYTNLEENRYDRGGKGIYGLMVTPYDYYRETLIGGGFTHQSERFRKPIYGGDHTKSNSDYSGSFLYVIPANPDKLKETLKKQGKDTREIRTIYDYKVPVYEFGKTNYKASMWISSVGERDGEFSVKLSAIAEDGTLLGSATGKTPGLIKTDNRTKIQWRKVEFDFNSWDNETFKGQYIRLKIELVSANSYEYGFGIDDIKLEAGYVWVEKIQKGDKITLKPHYDLDLISSVYGNTPNISFQWSYTPTGSTSANLVKSGYIRSNFKPTNVNCNQEIVYDASKHRGKWTFSIRPTNNTDPNYIMAGAETLNSLDMPMEPTVGSNQIKISSNITYDDLEDYFGNNCKNVCYEWYHKPVGSNTFVKFGGGQFGGDMNLLTLPLNAYDLSRNGTWKLVMWDGVRRLEKEIVVNYTLDQIKQRRTRASFDDFDQDLDFVNDGESLFIDEESDNIGYYTIYDLSGRVVVYSNDQPVNIAPLKNGIYILDMNGKQTKFIKK